MTNWANGEDDNNNDDDDDTNVSNNALYQAMLFLLQNVSITV